MTTPTTVTDPALERMLARRAHRADPIGLADAVFAALETIEPRRGPRLGVPAWWLPSRPSRGLAWMLVVATLLLALLASALVGTSLLQSRPPIALVPTGGEAMAPESGVYDRVVADGAGTLWAIGTGHVTRFDLASGKRQTWTVADDAAFAYPVVAPARAGGVWIWSGTSIRRFTGDGFREAIPMVAGQPGELVETPGGSLWAASADRGVERWDSPAWVASPAGRPTVAADHLLVRGENDVWVSNWSVGPDGAAVAAGVSHLQGGGWVTYDATDLGFPAGAFVSLAVAQDGSIWATAANYGGASFGITRFDGWSWTRIDGPGFPVWSLAAAPDGSVWATSDGSTSAVARYADARWTTYGAEDGLVGTPSGRVSATAAGTFVGTDAGLLRLAGERWVPAWPDAADAPSVAESSGRLLAVSADEAWAADARGLWHFVDDRWTGPIQTGMPKGAMTRDLALAGDGTLWVATDSGVAALRDGRWTVVSRSAALSIAVGADGTAWVGSSWDQVVGLRLDGAPPRTVACPNGSFALAITTDGSVYAGQFSYSGTAGLARFDGQACRAVDPLGDGLGVEVTDLVADPDGGLVAVMFRGGPSRTPGSGDTYTNYLARYDGTRWTVLDEYAFVMAFTPGGTAVAPSGEVWRSGYYKADVALERFDGQRWIPVVTGYTMSTPISIAPDGVVWFGGPSGVLRLTPGVRG